MVGGYVPVRGDIVDVNFDPTKGKEQAHDRPALVLSPDKFNERTGLVLVAPISSTIRGHLFEVPFNAKETKGVVLMHQMRTIDYAARVCTFRDKMPETPFREALAKARTLIT